jgi:hypothetical protein
VDDDDKAEYLPSSLLDEGAFFAPETIIIQLSEECLPLCPMNFECYRNASADNMMVNGSSTSKCFFYGMWFSPNNQEGKKFGRTIRDSGYCRLTGFAVPSAVYPGAQK